MSKNISDLPVITTSAIGLTDLLELLHSPGGSQKNQQITLGQLQTALQCLVISAGGKVWFPATTSDVQLVAENDGGSTVLLSVYVDGSLGAGATQIGLADGAAFFKTTNSSTHSVLGQLYMDGTGFVGLSNQSTGQEFLINADGTLTIYDASGTGIVFNGFGNVNFSGGGIFTASQNEFQFGPGPISIFGSQITLPIAPIISTGFFAGASITLDSASVDTTGTITSIVTTGYTVTFDYTPGSTTAPGAVLDISLAQSTPSSPAPFCPQVLSSSVGGNLSSNITCTGASPTGFSIASSIALTSGTHYTFTISLLP